MSTAVALLLLSSLFSGLAAGQMLVTAPWMALTLTDKPSSVAMISISSISSICPILALAPLIGVVVDRCNQARLAAWMDFARCAVLLILAALTVTGKMHILYVMVGIFLMASFFEFTRPAVAGLLMQLVTREDLLKWNYRHLLSRECGYVLGTASAGFIISYAGLETVILSNAILLLGAMASMFLLAKHAKDPRSECGLHVRTSTTFRIRSAFTVFVGDIRAGFEHFRERRSIHRPYLILGIANLAMRLAPLVLPAFCLYELKADAKALGFVESGWALGAIVAGVAVPSVAKKIGKLRTLACSLIGLAAGFFTVALAAEPTTTMVAYILIGACGQLGGLIAASVQAEVDHEFIGRVQMTFSYQFALVLLPTIGMFGYLADHVSTRLLYAGCGLLGLFALSLMQFALVQGRLRSAPLRIED